MTTPVTPAESVVYMDPEEARKRLAERARVAADMRARAREQEGWYDQETRRLRSVAVLHSQQVAAQHHAQERARRDLELARMLEHSPRRVAVDVWHDARLDVEGLETRQQIPAGELDGCPVTVLRVGRGPLDWSIRVACVETALGVEVLRSNVFEFQQRVPFIGEHGWNRAGAWVGNPGDPVCRVRLRAPAPYYRSLVDQHCRLWALGDAEGLGRLIF